MHSVHGKVGFLVVVTQFLYSTNRFHQYYVSGETADCSQWKENFADCELWVDRCFDELPVMSYQRSFIGYIQGRQGGSAQGDCQGEGLSPDVMKIIDCAMW